VVEVRTIAEDEVDRWTTAMLAGFHKVASVDEQAFYRPNIDPDRTYGAFDGPSIVGTARSFPSPLTVPGPVEVSVAAVTGVTVRASHRRRGLLTQMMRLQLEDFARRGEPVAMLIASEAPIYGRFGYGAASENARIEVAADRLHFTGGAPCGTVRYVDAHEFRRVAPPVYERFRVAQPGAIGRSARWWDMITGIVPRPGGEAPGFMAVHADDAGEPDGYVRYTVAEAWSGRAAASSIVLKDLVATSADAYEALWRFVTAADWIVSVAGDDRPTREPLASLVADARHVVQRDRSDFLWVHLVDVAAALAARRYRVADRIVIEVAPGFGPPGSVRVVLDGGPDGATCGPTADPADLTVTRADLGAAYLGSTPLWLAAAARRVEAHRPGAVEAFDRMFGQDGPAWCHTWF
jgi:predicted acetyltransferase